MPSIEFSDQEAATLIEILESSLKDIRTERVRTDNRAWHAHFVQQEHFVNDVIRRLARTRRDVAV